MSLKWFAKSAEYSKSVSFVISGEGLTREFLKAYLTWHSLLDAEVQGFRSIFAVAIWWEKGNSERFQEYL